jgi:diacylglycerol kinase family enzyme
MNVPCALAGDIFVFHGASGIRWVLLPSHGMASSDVRLSKEVSASVLTVLLNPQAGTTEQVRRAVNEDERFRVRECDASDLEAALTEEVEAGASRVVVSGGDGTLAIAADYLRKSQAELAVVPGGTLNHFARHHGIPINAKAALELAFSGHAKAADVATVNDRLFLNTSSIGVYTSFVRRRDHWRSKLGYLLASTFAAVQTAARSRRLALALEHDGQRTVYRTPLVFVGVDENRLRPPLLSDSNDGGGLTVIAVRSRSIVKMGALAFAAVLRDVKVFSSSDQADTFKADQFTIQSKKSDLWVAVDGETVKMSPPFEYRLLRSALKVVVPEEASGHEPYRPHIGT